jgi:hypothetical protein
MPYCYNDIEWNGERYDFTKFCWWRPDRVDFFQPKPGAGNASADEPVVKPFYCNPKVLDAIKKAYMRQLQDNWQIHDAGSEIERGFVVNPAQDGDVNVTWSPMGDRSGSLKQTVTRGTTLGAFHTHGQNSLGLPSTPENNIKGSKDHGDTLKAALTGVDFYVISREGLAIAPAPPNPQTPAPPPSFLFKANNFSDWFKKLNDFCNKKE